MAVERPSPDHAGENPGGTPMTDHTAVIPDVEADTRWSDWRKRGATNDRRTATRMRRLMFLIAAALIAWLAVQLT